MGKADKQKTIKVALSEPITFDNKQISEVSLRRPTVGDVAMAQRNAASQMDVEFTLVSLLSGLQLDAINKLDLADYRKVGEALKQLSE